MTVLYFLCAVGFLTLGHVCKAIRWRRFVGVYEDTPLPTLLSALASGYLVSFYLPLHLGEVVRVALSGRKMKNGYGYAMATIAVDRCLDVVCVALIFLVLATITASKTILHTALTYLILTVALLTVLLLVALNSRPCKKMALLGCSVFNEKIKFRLLLFLWSLISSFKDLIRKVNVWKLLLDTVIMWAAYLASYAMLARMLCRQGAAVGFVDVFYMMFHTGALFRSTFAVTSGMFRLVPELLLCAFILVPLPLLLLASVLMRKAKPATASMRLLPHLEPEEQMQFLNAYFEGERPEAMHEFLSMNADACIIRDCSSGSDATTMLCMTKDGTVYRKYAFGTAAAEKLFEQVQWLHEQTGKLPLPEICNEKRGKYSYRYDMPYDNSAVGFFEYIHSQSAEKSWHILRSVLETLQEKLYTGQTAAIDEAMIERYVTQKVEGNLETISQSRALRALCEYETLEINGVTYRGLPRLRKMFEIPHLREIFQAERRANVHGDLTIENIVCRPEHDDFYIIDPNPDNPVKTAGVDYAKLLQSLHGGYEFLRYSRPATVEGNAVNFLQPNSERYRQIYCRFDAWMAEHMTFEEHRSVYYHEMIHWLRLMPYKMRKSEKGAIKYFAAMIVVMNDIYDRYEEEK